MSNETKREVFDEVRYKFRNFKNEHRHGMYASPDSIDHYLSDALKRYAAALPDDLPVIPEAISDAIKFYWTTYGSEKGLTDLLFDLVEPWRIGVEKVVYAIHEDIRKYYLLHSDVIARAWVLGVWRVDETGEIVKLEEEK